MVRLYERIEYLFNNQLFDSKISIGVYHSGFRLINTKTGFILDVPKSTHYQYYTTDTHKVIWLKENIKARYLRAKAEKFLSNKK